MALLLSLWIAIFITALAGPPLLDDADATHAQAAQAMLRTGDFVTLHVNGIRYLEKPPLPYWIAAASLHLFPSYPAFAIHLPLALTVLGLALLGYAWSRRAFGSAAALYAGIFVLTAAGVFLFTRVFIPDALLSLLLALSLYLLQRSLDHNTADTLFSRTFPYEMWATLALAVLTKGLVAPVFFGGTALLYMFLTGDLKHWRRLRPITGILLFLIIAAPWHILAGLHNTGSRGGFGFAPGHGFFWFYFVNEHLLRFLGRRIPRDYNKLPATLYWLLHLVWLFPWSLFTPAALLVAWRRRRDLLSLHTASLAQRTVLLLGLFSAIILAFFSLSTNQEYYTFPVYLPLLMLLAAALAYQPTRGDTPLRRCLSFAFAAFFVLGLAISIALGWGLWNSRHLPFVSDIGALLAHRGVGDYTLSMSHFFDLTGPSFAALRLPAALAALAFAIGPTVAFIFYRRRRLFSAIFTMSITSAVFLIAAHIALCRFAPMLSSADFAANIQSLEHNGSIAPGTEVMLFGDQAYGSSIPFYLGHPVLLVDGRSTSMLFGSTFPDAPPIFLTAQQLLAQWGHGQRKILFVPPDLRDQVDQLLGSNKLLLKETSGKALYTDRALDTPSSMKDSQ
ncbi:glycosyltransferase family 39 protein [Granulicella sp. 5B5]|uniref:glycosyltransferase family 39 protein n=1 Tax=Granulicella sp. 5B5 TaxID=1617967 RepID=UPI002106E918|nr:glycosyltransferase family 39 protein [Granulicella sp. 5B5]